MKIYYAHPMSWYGTEREKDDLACLEANTPLHAEVINPRDMVVEQLEDKMFPFVKAVQEADAIAYRTFDDGSIGAGVGLELFTAAVWGKQIFRLVSTDLNRKVRLFEEAHGLGASFGPRLITIVQTRDYIKRGVM